MTEKTTAKPLDKLIEKAEALLVPQAAGYNSRDVSYNQGVQAVIDLLKAQNK